MSTVTVVFGPDGPTALEIGWGFEEMFSAMLLGSLTATATEPFNVGGWPPESVELSEKWVAILPFGCRVERLDGSTKKRRELEGAVATTVATRA
jgi:hypothetical protein